MNEYEQLAEALRNLRHALFIELVRIFRIEQIAGWLSRRLP